MSSGVGRKPYRLAKRARHVGKRTLEQLKAYHWPGNIRELQNVVERAVILCETDTFVVDESWLKRKSADSAPHEAPPFLSTGQFRRTCGGPARPVLMAAPKAAP